jgi:hypothetical protein
MILENVKEIKEEGQSWEGKNNDHSAIWENITINT